MAETLAYPFRLGHDGRPATIEQGTTEHDAQRLLHICATRPGERPMVPGFGISDPTFAGVDLGEIAAQVDLWGPRVELVDVTLDVDHADNSTRVSMRFR